MCIPQNNQIKFCEWTICGILNWFVTLVLIVLLLCMSIYLMCYSRSNCSVSPNKRVSYIYYSILIFWYSLDESVEQKAYSTNDYLRVTEEQARDLVPEEQRKGIECLFLFYASSINSFHQTSRQNYPFSCLQMLQLQ